MTYQGSFTYQKKNICHQFLHYNNSARASIGFHYKVRWSKITFIVTNFYPVTRNGSVLHCCFAMGWVLIQILLSITYDVMSTMRYNSVILFTRYKVWIHSVKSSITERNNNEKKLNQQYWNTETPQHDWKTVKYSHQIRTRIPNCSQINIHV